MSSLAKRGGASRNRRGCGGCNGVSASPFPCRQEALLAAISEKDANIALLELSSSKKKTQEEVAALKREKDRLVQQLKQQVQRQGGPQGGPRAAGGPLGPGRAPGSTRWGLWGCWGLGARGSTHALAGHARGAFSVNALA